jgi:HK97 family phage portal protein
MILDSLVAMRGNDLEDPRISLSNASYWEALSGGARTKAGARVDEHSAQTIAAVWSAVTLLAGSLAIMPWLTYRRVGRGKERAIDHPLYRLLHDAPNSEMTPGQFKETLQAHALLWGNGYAEKEMDGSGRVVGLWPLMPDRTWVERRGRRKIVFTRLPDSAVVALNADRVFHVPGLGYNGLMGKNVIQLARESLGLAKAEEGFAARFFGQGSQPAGVLKVPTELTDQAFDRLKSSWETQHTGLDNAQRTAILEGGAEWQQLGISNEDSQFIQSRKFSIEEIARWFNVPPHKLKQLDRATFSNIEHQDLEYVKDSVMVWAVRWEQQANRSLLLPSERATFFTEFEFKQLLRADNASRAAFYTAMLQSGAMSQNDIRTAENMNPITGGDTYWIPLNLGDSSRPPEPEPTRGVRCLALYRDTARRVLNRELIQARRAVARAFRTDEPVAHLRGWIAEFYLKHGKVVAREFVPAFTTHAEALGVSTDVTNHSLGWGEEWVRASREALVRILDEVPLVEMEAALTEWLDTWEDTRADDLGVHASAYAGDFL